MMATTLPCLLCAACDEPVVEELGASCDPADLTPEQRELFEQARKVCLDGEGIAEAADYSMIGRHPIVVLDDQGACRENLTLEFFPDHLPRSVSELELVACVTEESKDETYCDYDNGAQLVRRQFGRSVILRAAATGEVVEYGYVAGSEPPRCPASIASGADDDLEGSHVPPSAAKALLEPFVDGEPVIGDEAAEEGVKIFDVASGEVERTFLGKSGPLAYSPDGNWLALSSGAGTAGLGTDVSIYDARTFQQRPDLRRSLRVAALGFAADSSKFFVYDTEALHVFPTDGGDGVRRPVELDWAVSPDLEQLASVEYTDQRPFVVIRRISNDEELQRFASDRRPDAYFAGLSLSDAGLLAAAMHEDAIPNDTIEFWDLEKAIAYPTEVELEGEVMQLTFAPGGDWLVAVTHDAERVPQTHVLRLAASQDDVEVLEQRVDAYDASSNGAQPAAISADARRISSTVLRDDGMCCFTVRDLTTGALIAEFEPAPDAPTIYTALSPDGRQLAGTVYRVREE